MSEASLPRRGFLAVGIAAALPVKAAPARDAAKPLTVLHLTDIHIRPEHDAPQRCEKILREIRKRFPDIGLVVNTGDSIYAADYGNITRERVLEQWSIWEKSVMTQLKGLPMLHAIGNHDPWWAGGKEDEMYGIPYVCKRLGIEQPYSLSNHGGWTFLTLENSRGSMDEGQQQWLFKTLAELPEDKPLVLASHLPLFSLAGDYDGGNMKGAKQVVDKLAARKAPAVAVSGHIHIQSSESLWNVRFHCNGALSGSWWEPGDAGDGSYKRTPPGFAVLRLWPDGRNECRYFPLEA